MKKRPHAARNSSPKDSRYGDPSPSAGAVPPKSSRNPNTTLLLLEELLEAFGWLTDWVHIREFESDSLVQRS